MEKTQTLSWSIPFAIHKQNAIVEIKRAFPAIALVRIAIVFTAIFLPIRFLLPRWLPDLDADWAELYFVPIFGMGLLIGFLCLVSFLPPRISVTIKGIMVQAGQHGVLHRFTDIASIRVDETTKPYATLKICLLGQQKDKEYPIAPTIPINGLASRINELRLNR
jgi:hypothetical protein